MRKQHPCFHAQSTPSKAAYIMAESGEVVSYEQLDQRTNQAAHLFRDLGLNAKDGILIFAENHARFLELCWAAQRAGLYYTAVSWHLTESELSYILNDSGAKAFFASSRFASVAQSAARSLDESIPCFSLGASIEGFRSYEKACAQHPTSPISDEIAGMPMLYTSGTTGYPKGVKRPFLDDPIDLVRQGDLFFYQEGFDETSVGLSAGPLYHTAPMNNTMRNQRFGGTSIVIDRFDPRALLELIDRYQVTHLTCVPTHFVRLLKLPEEVRKQYSLSSLKLVLHTAAPCPADVKQAMIDWFGPILFEYYGGTEGIGGTMIRCEDWLKNPGSIGKPVAGNVYVLDESTWQEMPTGEPGVLYFDVTGDFSYHGDAKKTASVTSPQGWRTLGDIGYVNDDGYVFLTDRKANMIISGGVNIYPQEVENRLIMHPAVLDVAVFGVPNPDFGEEVKAVVQVQAGQESPKLGADLIDYCRQGLAAYKCPRSVDFTDKLPREENGKLYKRKLAEQYQTD